MQADIGRLGLDVEWQRSGMLAVATEPHQVDVARSEAASDGEGRFLAQTEVRGEVAFADLPGGPVQPRHVAIVHPAKLAFELARACQEAGVQIYEHTNATSHGLRRSRRFASRAGGGTITARPASCLRPTSFRACCGATGCTPCRCTTTCWPPSR